MSRAEGARDRRWRWIGCVTPSSSSFRNFTFAEWYPFLLHTPSFSSVTDEPPQSSRIEILNEGGFRSDGRKQYELREIAFDSSPQAGADGSARVSHGLTEVLVSVFGPREARVRAQTLHDRAAIHVEVNIAPFSTGDRRRRGRGD